MLKIILRLHLKIVVIMDHTTISGVGATTFNISVSESPEQLSYIKTTADISYTTKSYAAEGGVGSFKSYIWWCKL